MQRIIAIALIIVSTSINTQAQTGAEAFWSNLQKLCGNAYSGQLIVPENDEGFSGKELVMHVRSCSTNEIKVPFFVGDDLSRTWVFTKKKGVITLKHDHRHEDGSEDEVTQYGGTSSNEGAAGLQMFPADQETATLLPRAATNVWSVTLSETMFSYNLNRIYNHSIFKVEFDLTKTIATPPAPWGWNKKK